MVFAVGDYVQLHTRNLPLRIPGSAKLKPIWIGPYKVEAVVRPNAYQLALLTAFKQLHSVFNISVLKWYHGSTSCPPDPIKVFELEEYEVSTILVRRCSVCRKKLEFVGISMQLALYVHCMACCSLHAAVIVLQADSSTGDGA